VFYCLFCLKGLARVENVRSAFSASLGLPTVEKVVKYGQIGVLRIGKDEVVHWTIPLQAPVAPQSTSVVTLPPGMLILKGTGDKLYNSVTMTTPTGWNAVYSYNYYQATATLFCPGWHAFGESVGLSSGSGQTIVVVDRLWTWTHA